MATNFVTQIETINEAIHSHLVELLPEATADNVYVSDDPLYATERTGRVWFVIVPPKSFPFDEASFIGGGDENTEVTANFDIVVSVVTAIDRADQILQRQTSFIEQYGIHYHLRRLLKIFSNHYLLSGTTNGNRLINEVMRPVAMSELLNDRSRLTWQLTFEIRFSINLDD